MRLSKDNNSVRIIAVISLILVLLAGLTGCNEESKKYEQAIASGDSSLASNNYEEAINYFEHAKSIKPGEEYPEQQIEKARELQKSWEKQRKFDQSLKKGDRLFNDGKYQQAIDAYYNALEANPHNKYALEQIELAEVKIAEQQKEEEAMKNPYHIVVGSFENKNYAEQLQQKLLNNGYDSKLIPRQEGYTAVSIYSYPNLTAAWNKLNRVLNMERFYDVDPWIVRYNISKQ